MTSTLTNSGNVPLTITSITLTGVTNNNFIETNNCTSPLASNGTCTISASFAPSATGSQNASIQIVTNAASSPDTITLSGTAQ